MFDPYDPIWIKAQCLMSRNGLLPFYNEDQIRDAVKSLSKDRKEKYKRKFRKEYKRIIKFKFTPYDMSFVNSAPNEFWNRERKRYIVCKYYYDLANNNVCKYNKISIPF